jgi:hypothetical protein
MNNTLDEPADVIIHHVQSVFSRFYGRFISMYPSTSFYPRHNKAHPAGSLETGNERHKSRDPKNENTVSNAHILLVSSL